jgi:GAF domain-containing protein
MLQSEVLVGAIEILSFDEPLESAQLDTLGPLAELAAAGLVSSRSYEQERNGSLNSITRLTQFYDIEKVFSSTLEMDELLPIIGGKMREMLECEAVNLWMVQGDGSILLMHQAGEDPSTQLNMVQKGGEGLAGDVSDTGEAILIEDSADERLSRRNANAGEGAVRSIMIAPLMDKESLVGVVEAVNRLDGTPFDEDDLFVLTSLNESAALALHNASLLLAERKVEVLQALVSVSQEITSTLDLTRVTQAIVNGPQAAIPYERAAIAVEQAGKLRLGAISGRKEINANDPQLKPLEELLHWAALSSDGVYIRQHGEEIDDPREETKAKFARYFAESGMRAFYGLPLIDESGQVGVLAFESSDPDFLNDAHLEMIKVLAAQATVALRNAQMYKEVPFISVLEPVLKRKRKFFAMEKRRRQATIALALTALLFLLLCPLPLRVDGDATVAPVHTAQVMPEI